MTFEEVQGWVGPAVTRVSEGRMNPEFAGPATGDLAGPVSCVRPDLATLPANEKAPTPQETVTHRPPLWTGILAVGAGGALLAAGGLSEAGIVSDAEAGLVTRDEAESARVRTNVLYGAGYGGLGLGLALGLAWGFTW